MDNLAELVAANEDLAAAIAASTETLLGGVPHIAGFEALIENALATGINDFNQENKFINLVNSLVQGNEDAQAAFDSLIEGQETLIDQITALYEAFIPASAQSEAGLAYLTRPEAIELYQFAVIDRGIEGPNAEAIAAFAVILNVAYSENIGVGNSVNDLLAAIENGTAQLPESGNTFTPIEVADGSDFDGDEFAVTLLDAEGNVVSHFDTVQAAEDAAQAGYTIAVNSQVAGDVTVDVADLTIRGADGAAILGGIYLTAGAAGATISGLTINGTFDSSTTEGATIFVQANDVTISNNVITGEDGATSGIVTTGGLSGLQIVGNEISGYEGLEGSAGYGIFINPTVAGEGAIVTGNTVEGNRWGIMFDQDAILVGPSAEDISGNTFGTNERGDVAAWVRATTADFSTITFAGNTPGAEEQSGLNILSSGGSTITGTAFDDVFIDLTGSNDVFIGGDGADVLDGGGGNDRLDGGASDVANLRFNLLTGGDGNDVFVANSGFAGVLFDSGEFFAAIDGLSGVMDFQQGGDVDLLDMGVAVTKVATRTVFGTGLVDIDDLLAEFANFDAADFDQVGETIVLQVTGGALVGTYVATVTGANASTEIPGSGEAAGNEISVIALAGTEYELTAGDFFPALV